MKNQNKYLFKQKKQNGSILLVCLFVMIAVVSLSGYAMKTVIYSERAAGNFMEKQRSLQLAESAVRYGEWWISLNNHGEYQDCQDVVDGNVFSLIRVCKNNLINPEVTPWKSYMTYKPETMAVDDNAGLSNTGDINYYKDSQLYIAYIGENRVGRLYEVYGLGYGGNQKTISVVQSTFQLGFNSIDLGGL